MEHEHTYTAFVGETQIVSGSLETMLTRIKTEFDHDAGTLFLIFEDQSGRQVDFDLRGTLTEVLARALPAPTKSGPGRPKLGVVSREITLLPRHWAWLEEQPNGASAALRRLIDEVRKQESDGPEARVAREAVGRFLTAMAGNLPGYEAACRALYAVDRSSFEILIQAWPRDIRAYLQGRVGEAFWTKG
jgi:uncharacterized protein